MTKIKSTNNFFIHNLSDVQTNTIGEGTTIWQYAIILPNAQIGSNCNINCHTFIENDVVIGNNVTIKSGVFIWDGITIEDDVFVGTNVAFINDLYPRSKKRVTFCKTVIQKGASLGANSAIKGGLCIGYYAMIGIGAVVTRDVPSHALVYGNPATIKGWVDELGNLLKPIDTERLISITGEVYLKTESGLQKQ